MKTTQNNSKQLKTIFAALIILFAVSCKKNDSTESFTSGKPDKTKLSTLTTSSYQNPYEIIGVMHNEAIAYIEDSLTAFYNGTSVNNAALRTLIANYYSNNAYKIDSASGVGYNSDFNYFDSSFALLNSIKSYEFGNITSISLSDDAMQYVNTVMSLIEDHESPSTLIPEILELELTIDNLGIPENEKVILYCASSVARHSSEYWYNHEPFGTTGNIDYALWQEIVGADFTGALVGGARAAVAGISSGALVFGPGGVVLSAASGAVVGGIWSSFGDFMLNALVNWAFWT